VLAHAQIMIVRDAASPIVYPGLKPGAIVRIVRDAASPIVYPGLKPGAIVRIVRDAASPFVYPGPFLCRCTAHDDAYALRVPTELRGHPSFVIRHSSFLFRAPRHSVILRSRRRRRTNLLIDMDLRELRNYQGGLVTQ